MADTDRGEAGSVRVTPAAGSEAAPAESAVDRTEAATGPDRLTVVAFATAHVAALTLAGVGAAHLSGGLGPTLSSLETRVGVAAFGALWALALVTHRHGFARADPWSVRDRSSAAAFLLAGAAWGGVTGVGFLWAVLGPLLLGAVVSGATTIGALLGVATLRLLLFATALALAIGAAVGFVAAVADAAVVAAVERVARRTESAGAGP